ncbi:MAG TPA: DUF2157 domain-containing protein, partial [Candidatus Omnitrophota bacterium]|nr:DUF2157 domain-containing protein [Candidatus Omnitrophota bacterium]
MNKKTIEALYHELPDLVQKGVLTQDAAEKLRAHYGEAKSQDKKWLMMLIYGLAGTILIGLGIILLFAHNWDEFSKQTRTVLSLLPLLLAQTFAGWVLLKRPASNILKECSATFLSLMVGSCMALICQTYNISGTPTTFTMTWMILILPLVYLLQASIPAVIYCIGISSWASHMMFTDRSLAILFWPLIALVIPHFLWSLKQEKFALRSTILSFVMMLCIFISGQGTLLGNLPQSSIVTSGALVTIFYLLGSYKFNGLSSNWQTPLLRLGALGIFIEGFILSFRFSW